jgi:peptide/nickel transport system substrate-binding protein
VGDGKTEAGRDAKVPRRRCWAGAGAAAAAVSLVLSGCTTGGGGPDGEDGYSTDTMRVALMADPNSFLPTEYTALSSLITGHLLYATLLYGDEDNTTVPGLASEYEVDPHGGEFTIREDATCADGTPLTPTVVADSLEAFAAASTVKEVVFGKGDPVIEADDEAGVVSISLSEPWADMERGLALTQTGIVCPAGLADPEGTAAGEVEGAFSGGYVLAGHQPGVSVDLELREEGFTFPEYAVPLEGVPPQKVAYSIMSDYNAVANGLLTDTLDYSTVNGEAMARVTEEEGFTTSRYAGASMFIVFNQREGMPMADAETRRAVAQAVSREAFNDAATDGEGELLSSYVPAGVPCAHTGDEGLIAQDAEAASAVLDGLSLNVFGTTSSGPNGAGNSYVAQALEAAGAEVSVRSVDDTTWATELATRPESWDLTVYPQLNLPRTQYSGLAQLIGPLPEQGGQNSSGAERPETEALVGEAMAQPDEEARCAVYEEIQTSLLDDAAFVPLATLPTQVTTREGFSIRQYGGYVPTISMRITG